MLKGNRVILRAVEKRDVALFYDMWSDDDIRKFDGAGQIVPSKEYIMENFQVIMNSYKKHLTIINEKGSIIGYLTYEPIKDCKNVFEIGITINKNFWSRGYGKDSIRTILKFLFLETAAERVELRVCIDNIRAIGCYKKCGFEEEGINKNRFFSEGKYKDVLMMSILKDKFHKFYDV
ncbi:RimJ/RimL family protein N-acetyltransferase [Hathewaya limosa]|uniref:RimJ/RimL family protein N-acetyltransferase n=2 Tax=Hathewaya limosa TaxID=1536 RepID=A0ABU0JV86_HATLI|nr:RimJ/RimL family protein N-acetyltransferase [Hathewaya limosa]